MKKTLILLIILLLFSNLAFAAQITDQEWREDLNYLQKELPRRHKNLFFQYNRKEFNKDLNLLKKDLPQLSDLEITFRLAEVFAEIGDTHTALNNSRFFNEYYPVYFKKFEDDYRVIAADQKYSNILGAKLLSINGHNIDELKNEFSNLITADNQTSLDYKLASFLNLKEVLIYLDLIGEKNEYIFEKNGEKLSITFDSFKISEMAEARMNLVKLNYQPSIVLKNAAQLFYSDFIPADNILYFQYNKCWSRELAKKHNQANPELPSFAEEKRKILEMIKNKEIKKLVIDLRYNSGGDSSQGTQFAKELSEFKEQFETYVIIGADTFSSAIINALDFKEELDAYLIGTATMGKPNHYGEVRVFTLPNTELRLSYSTKFFRLIDNRDPDSLYPDITVETSFEDFIKGEDTVLNMIKSIK